MLKEQGGWEEEEEEEEQDAIFSVGLFEYSQMNPHIPSQTERLVVLFLRQLLSLFILVSKHLFQCV